MVMVPTVFRFAFPHRVTRITLKTKMLQASWRAELLPWSRKIVTMSACWFQTGCSTRTTSRTPSSSSSRIPLYHLSWASAFLWGGFWSSVLAANGMLFYRVIQWNNWHLSQHKWTILLLRAVLSANLHPACLAYKCAHCRWTGKDRNPDLR